jgi:hypothetical protein
MVQERYTNEGGVDLGLLTLRSPRMRRLMQGMEYVVALAAFACGDLSSYGRQGCEG